MDENKKITEGVLLYDPLFEHKPDTVIRDDPKKGFWGKAIVKKYCSSLFWLPLSASRFI